MRQMKDIFDDLDAPSEMLHSTLLSSPPTSRDGDGRGTATAATSASTTTTTTTAAVGGGTPGRGMSGLIPSLSPRNARRTLSSLIGVVNSKNNRSPRQQQQQQQQIEESSHISPATTTTTTTTTIPLLQRPSKRHSIDTSTQRLYKFSDRDHPLGVMKAKYEQVIDFVRVNPQLLAKCCKNIVIMSQHCSESLPAASSAASGSSSNVIPHQQIRDIVNLLVFSLYGNLVNPLEDKLMRQFIRICIDTAYKYCCTSPMEIFNNAFIKHLLLTYTKRKGAGFVKYIMQESMSEVLYCDDFDVRLEHLKPHQVPAATASPPYSPSTPVSRHSNNSHYPTPSTPPTASPSSPAVMMITSFDKPVVVEVDDLSAVGASSLPGSPCANLNDGSMVDSIISDVSQHPEETTEVIVKALENRSGPDEEIERQLRKNTANLYSLCTQFMRLLSQCICSLPHNVRYIMKYLYKPKRFSKSSESARRRVLKNFFFSHYFVPLMTDAECVGFNEFPIVQEKKEMLAIIATVLQNCALDNKFDTSSPFVSMNLFIEQNNDLMDRLFTDLVDIQDDEDIIIDGVDQKQIGALLNKSISKILHISSGSKFSNKMMMSSSSSSGEEDNHENNLADSDIASDVRECASHLSPICVSTSEVEYIITILRHSSEKIRRRIPDKIKDAMKEIDRWKSLKQGFHFDNHDKLSVMSMHEATVSDYLPDMEAYTRDFSTNNVKYLIQQILTSVNYIEHSSLHNEKFEQILQTLLLREKMLGNLSTASTIQELLNKLRTSRVSDNVFDELRQEILLRRQYVHRLTENHTSLLREIDLLEEQVQFLNDEKERYEMVRENERLQPFFQQLQGAMDKDLLRELEKSPFLEDQERRITYFYDRTKQKLFQHIRYHFNLSPIEIERGYDRLKRFTMMKVHPKLMNEHSIHFQKDRALQEKIAQLRELKPEQLEIKPVYVHRCDSAAAQEELRKMNRVCTAEGKLGCITRCCLVLIEVMRITYDRYPSVDDFLPILIYNVIKANPPRLVSNIKFIERFINFFNAPQEHECSPQTHQSSLNDFAGEYYVRHFEAAVLFLEQVELNSLLSVKCKSRNVPTGSPSPSHSKGMTESLRRIKEEEENRRQQQQQQRHQYQHYRREDDNTDDGDDGEDQPVSQSEQEERLQIHARIISDDSVLTVDLDSVRDDEVPISPRVADPEADDREDNKKTAIRHQPLADSDKQRAVVKNLRKMLIETKTRSPDEYRKLLQDLQACIVDHIS